MLLYQKFVLLPDFETNTYLLWDVDSKAAAIIDPSAPSEELLKFVSDYNLNILYIINTHGHADHIGGNAFFAAKYNAKACIHHADAGMLNNPKLNLSAFIEANLSVPHADRLLHHGDSIELGTSKVSVIHTPGHTRGGICILADNLLFSGDTLFNLDIGRTDLPGGNEAELISSIRAKLLSLPDDTIVLPGHGPSSNIIDEKQNNPYI